MANDVVDQIMRDGWVDGCRRIGSRDQYAEAFVAYLHAGHAAVLVAGSDCGGAAVCMSADDIREVALQLLAVADALDAEMGVGDARGR